MDWLLSFNLFESESERRSHSILKLAVSQSLKQLLMQNVSFLDFSILSQQIMRSITVREHLHNASYTKEIRLWCKRGIHLDVIFEERKQKTYTDELHQKQFGVHF